MAIEDLNNPKKEVTLEGVQTSGDVVNRIQGGIEDAMSMRNVGVLCDEYLSAEFGDYDAGLYNRLLSFVETETGCFEEGSINKVDFENLCEARKKPRLEFISEIVEREKKNKGGNK